MLETALFIVTRSTWCFVRPLHIKAVINCLVIWLALQLMAQVGINHYSTGGMMFCVLLCTSWKAYKINKAIYNGHHYCLTLLAGIGVYAWNLSTSRAYISINVRNAQMSGYYVFYSKIPNRKCWLINNVVSTKMNQTFVLLTGLRYRLFSLSLKQNLK